MSSKGLSVSLPDLRTAGIPNAGLAKYLLELAEAREKNGENGGNILRDVGEEIACHSHKLSSYEDWAAMTKIAHKGAGGFVGWFLYQEKQKKGVIEHNAKHPGAAAETGNTASTSREEVKKPLSIRTFEVVHPENELLVDSLLAEGERKRLHGSTDNERTWGPRNYLKAARNLAAWTAQVSSSAEARKIEGIGKEIGRWVELFFVSNSKRKDRLFSVDEEQPAHEPNASQTPVSSVKNSSQKYKRVSK